MFDKVEARFAARAFFTGVLAFCFSMKASGLGSEITWPEFYNALLDGGIGALLWAGITPFSKTLEPNIGPRTREGA